MSGTVIAILVASAALLAPKEGDTSRWYALARAKYDQFARGLERRDPSFLKFVDPSFVYIGTKGERMSAKDWIAGMRQACLRNRDAKVTFRITEIRRKTDRLMVSYVWSYRYQPGQAKVPIPRLSESISTDTWKIVGNDIRMIVSKDFHLWNRPAKDREAADY